MTWHIKTTHIVVLNVTLYIKQKGHMKLLLNTASTHSAHGCRGGSSYFQTGHQAIFSKFHHLVRDASYHTFIMPSAFLDNILFTPPRSFAHGWGPSKHLNPDIKFPGFSTTNYMNIELLCTGILKQNDLLNRLLKSTGHGMLKSRGHGMLKLIQVANQWEA